MTTDIYNISDLKENFNKAQQQLKEWENNKIHGLSPEDYIFSQFQQRVDPIYFIENVLRAHLPESRRHLHSNQIELIRAACNPAIRRVAAMMARQCFAKGTLLIDSNNELIKVEDLKIGTKLKTPNGKSASVIQTVNGISQLYRIKNQENYDLSYDVTDNHNLVLTDGKKQIITTVKNYLQSDQSLYGCKCLLEGSNHDLSVEDIKSIVYYLPQQVEIYKNILNSTFDIKYLFIQEFLQRHTTWSNTKRYVYYANNMYEDILLMIKRIFWSMGYAISVASTDAFMFIKYGLTYKINIIPAEVKEYIGFTLDSEDNLCVLADNTIAHNSGKCFAKDTLIRLYNGEVKKVQDIKQTDILMGSDSKPRHIKEFARGQEQLADIFTDIGKFSVNISHELVVFDNENKKHYISVKDYIAENKQMKMKIAAIDYDLIYSPTTAYYAGFDHIFGYLLCTSLQTRKYIAAGLIDSLPIGFIPSGITLHVDSKLVSNVKELFQSMGYKVFPRFNANGTECDVNIIGDFSDIPVREKKEINFIANYDPYITFSIMLRDKGDYYGFSLKDDNKEFLLADGTIVHNTESIACFCAALICLYPQMRIGIFTPRIQQAEVTIGRSTVFFQMNEDKIPQKIKKLTKQIIELENGSYMQAVSGSDQSNIEGLTFDIAVLDEAQKISSYTTSERILPMLGACCLANTRILLTSGATKRIEDIVNDKTDKQVASFDEKTKKIVVGNIINYLDMGIKPVVKITLESGNDITTTLNHHLLTWLRDAVPRHPDWIQASNIKVGTRIGVPRILPFFGSFHESNARLLGLLIGDGSYGRGARVHFGSYSDALWEYISQFCIKIKYYRQFQTNDGKNYRAARMSELIPIVKAAGIYGQVSTQKTLPVNVIEYDKQSIQELLAGLFDTDGNFFYPADTNKARPTISFSNICKSIVDIMQELLLKLGIRAHIQYRKAKPHKYQGKEIKSNKEFYVLHILGKENIEAFYYNIPIIEEDKKDNLEKIYQYFKEHKFKIDKSILNTDLRFEKVKSVEFLGPQHVYDLTIDTYHTYIANNIISHNCNGKIIKIGTPKSRNHFYDSIEGKGSKEWFVIRKPWFECEQLHALAATNIPDHTDPTGERIRPYSTYVLSLMPKAIKQEYWPNRPDLWTDGEMSIQDFQTQYELKFAEGNTEFMSIDQIRRLSNGDFLWQPYGSFDEIYYAGIDFGNGEDATAISIIRYDPKTKEKQKIFAVDMKQVPYPQQIREILQIFTGPRPRFKVKKCVADYTGCGRPVIQALLEQGFTNLVGIIFNAKDKLTNTNSSYKLAMANYFVRDVDSDKFKYPSLENFIKSAGKNNQGYFHKMIGEHADLLVEYTNTGLKKIHAAAGGHDDTVASDWMANYASIIDQKTSKMPSGISYRMSR